MDPQIVLVDTNSYVRLYFSPLRPLLGVVVGRYRLMTLRELVAETRGRSGLTLRHAWLADANVQLELQNATIQFDAAEETQYDGDAAYYQAEGDRFLTKYCLARQLEQLRQLSWADAKTLAVALDKGYVLATDEWPLREFSQEIEGDDSGQRLPLMSSLDLLKLFLDAGMMSMEQLRGTVRQWILSEERLLHGWQQRFLQLFGDAPPTGQG
jgi:hypothetical protein